jgi:hypothetical protein
MNFPKLLNLNQRLAFLLVAALFLVIVVVGYSCGGGTTVVGTVNSGMGNVAITISDPPSCAVPAGATNVPDGSFSSVWITIRSIQAHISATADDNSSGWQELVPQLNSAPAQVDLLHLPAQGQCLLEQLGSTSLPVGDYQQIRLILLANEAPSGAAPTKNNCASLGAVFNCVVDGAGPHTLDLSSEANTGLKIPPGQIMGGPIHVAAGQSVDLNIDFNTCASIKRQGNGDFRLKPTLTAGVVSANTTGISGQIVDSVTSKPIAGAMVTLQFADKSGVDRIAMQEMTDATGHFGFCPLPAGAVFDVVADAITSAGTAYDVTVVFNVAGGSNLGAVPLVAETPAMAGASTGPGTIQGAITALNGMTGASIDATVSALQTVMVSGTSHSFTVPLFAGTSSVIQVSSTMSCPMGSPTGAFCASYTLVVPASNPNVGVFAAGKVTFTAPASGDVLYTVEADANNPTSNAAICSPSSQTISKDSNNMPLKVLPGAASSAARIDFSGCS